MIAAPDHDLLTAPLPRLIRNLSLPSVLGFLMFGLNALLDGIFVGLFLGEADFAGLTLAFPIVQGISGLGLMVGIGAANRLSLAIGARDQATLETILGSVVALSLIVGGGLTFLAVGLPQLTPLLLGWAEAGETALAAACTYLWTIMAGGLVNVMACGLGLVLRGEGRMNWAMGLMTVTTLSNALFSFVALTVLDMGIDGVAWATNLSYAVTIVVHLWLYARHGLSRSMVPDFRPRMVNIGRLVILGLPAFLTNITQLVQQIVVLAMIGRIGSDTDLAFFGVLSRLMVFAVTPVFGMSRALQPIVGTAFGAGRYSRVSDAFQISTRAGLVLMTVIAIPVLAAPQFWSALLQPGLKLDDAMIWQFRLFCVAMVLLPPGMFVLAALQSLGQAASASALLLSRQMLLFLPLAYVLMQLQGLTGIYAAYLIVDLILALLAFPIMRRVLSRLVSQGGIPE